MNYGQIILTIKRRFPINPQIYDNGVYISEEEVLQEELEFVKKNPSAIFDVLSSTILDDVYDVDVQGSIIKEQKQHKGRRR